MTGNTVTLHRVLRATPKKIYRAFTQPEALASWIPPYGFVCVVHSMDVKVGGSYKSSFINFSTGSKSTFGGTYLELKEDEFLKYNDQFDNPDLPGTMITSVWLKEVMGGTDIKIVQEGIPEMIPVEMCYMGWQESLEKLAKLVEPNIPDN